MPCYLVELNPLDLMDPNPSDTREMVNPNMLLREIKQMERLLPGAKIRGIVLQRWERAELEHAGVPREATTFVGIPLMERSPK